MNESLVAYSLLLLIVSLGTGAISLVVYRKSNKRASIWFSVDSLCICLWSFFALLQVHLPLSLQPHLIQTKFAFAWFVGCSWLLFSLYYTGFYRFVPEWTDSALVLLFGTMSVLSLTNHIHHLVWKDVAVSQELFEHVYMVNTPLYILIIGAVYAGISFGLLLLLIYGLKAKRISRLNLLILAISPAPSTFVSAGKKYGLLDIPASHLDYDAIATVLFIAAVFYTLQKHGFFSFVPFSREVVVREISKPILVIDNNGRIADYNSEMAELYPEIDGKLGSKYDELLPDDIEDEVEINGRVYSVEKTEIKVGDRKRGKSIILDDITETRERTEELQRQIDKLDEFASHIAEDVGNAISSALDSVDDLGEGKGASDDIVKEIEKCEETVERSLRLARLGKVVELVLVKPRRGVCEVATHVESVPRACSKSSNT